MNTFTKYLIAASLILIAFSAYQLSQSPRLEPGFGGSFYAPTQATTTINPYTWTKLATTTNDMVFRRFCSEAATPVYVAFGATSTKPYGTAVFPNTCYEMSEVQQNISVSVPYAIASNSTTTLFEIYK